MKTIIIGAILAGKAEFIPGPCVYLVRAGELVLYVGKSTYSAADRLLEHMGLELPSPGPDRLGLLIRDNRPEADGWEVDIYTPDDWKPYLSEVDPSPLDTVEQFLIDKRGPYLNVTHNRNNPNRKPLPDKYIKHRIANEGVRLE